jgi:hypothetical protein
MTLFSQPLGSIVSDFPTLNQRYDAKCPSFISFFNLAHKKGEAWSVRQSRYIPMLFA